MMVWLRLLFFVRMIDYVSFFFRIFMESLWDMLPFMFFFVVLLLGFTDALFKLSVIGDEKVKGARPI
jgi:hypothetical protein